MKQQFEVYLRAKPSTKYWHFKTSNQVIPYQIDKNFQTIRVGNKASSRMSSQVSFPKMRNHSTSSSTTSTTSTPPKTTF